MVDTKMETKIKIKITKTTEQQNSPILDSDLRA